MQSAAGQTPERDILPDILAPGLDVVFVGAAPSLYAAESGHYYAGPRNRFWLLLWQAGFTERQLAPEDDHLVLRYGIGLTGLMKGVASSDNSKLPPATEAQRAALADKLVRCSPGFVCFNGKDVWKMATAGVDCPWGLQRDALGSSRVFVAHSSSGRADGWGADRLYLYRELRSLSRRSRRMA